MRDCQVIEWMCHLGLHSGTQQLRVIGTQLAPLTLTMDSTEESG